METTQKDPSAISQPRTGKAVERPQHDPAVAPPGEGDAQHSQAHPERELVEKGRQVEQLRQSLVDAVVVELAAEYPRLVGHRRNEDGHQAGRLARPAAARGPPRQASERQGVQRQKGVEGDLDAQAPALEQAAEHVVREVDLSEAVVDGDALEARGQRRAGRS